MASAGEPCQCAWRGGGCDVASRLV